MSDFRDECQKKLIPKTEFGINLPQFHPYESTSLAPLGEFAEKVEALGFDSVWTLDRVFSSFPFLEPLSSLIYVAARTRRVKIGSAILMTPLRTPSILAKTAATIDFLSGGRMILGVALGGNSGEYAASGVPLNERVARLIEGLRIMRLLWSENDVSFQGRFWSLNHVHISPKPVRESGIPVWMGGSQQGASVNDAAVKRAAKYGDGWLGAGSTSLDAFADSYLRFMKYAKEFERDLGKLVAAKRVYLHVDSDREKARGILEKTLSAFYGKRFDVDGLCVYGSDKACAEQLTHFIEAGAQTLILHPVADHLGQAKVLAEDVIPKLR
ncbi:MAG: LLM class flavin-dependent oxidoreductase [Thaumarchaeota archaeon]|nr:LLM class flavin-dependent oxidoreductase [Nitrososphaerota archaeon]